MAASTPSIQLTLAQVHQLVGGELHGDGNIRLTGLAGLGDVIATCGSKLSRNHRLGEELAKGRTWADIEATLPGTAEGAYTVQAALALAEHDPDTKEFGAVAERHGWEIVGPPPF